MMNHLSAIPFSFSGWGALSEKGGLANKLMSLTLPILFTKECQPYFSKIRTPKITENMICTYSRGQDACQVSYKN